MCTLILAVYLYFLLSLLFEAILIRNNDTVFENQQKISFYPYITAFASAWAVIFGFFYKVLIKNQDELILPMLILQSLVFDRNSIFTETPKTEEKKNPCFGEKLILGWAQIYIYIFFNYDT